MTILAAGMLSQIEQMFEMAGKGATMGGQALLIAFLLVMGYVIRGMHRDNKVQMSSALAAHEKQHGELVAALTSEREANKKDQAVNHEMLVRIATESATGLQATAAAINGQTTAMNSLRDTLHGLRGDMQGRQSQRDLQNHP